LKRGRWKLKHGHHQVDEIMTVSEVADYLKISEVTTYKFVQEGKIPGFKIGRNWRVKRSDLAEFIEKQKRGERL
jgi:excisionase family DNA binding protein